MNKLVEERFLKRKKAKWKLDLLEFFAGKILPVLRIYQRKIVIKWELG